MREFQDSHNANNKQRRKHLLRSAKNQNIYLQSLRNYVTKLANVVKVDGNIKVPTAAQMRLHGKKVMELKHTLPHTRAEMVANATKGAFKVSGLALIDSVKDSTEAKIHYWDKLAPEKDLHEEAAKKMRTNELRKTLKLYFVGNVEMCIEIDRMPKGESSHVPNFLLNLIVTYCKEHSMTPPVPERTAVKMNSVQKEAIGMSVNELREELREVYNGDPDMLLKIRLAQKGNFASPDSLVSMFCDARKEGSTF
jgi:hypothetical protein